MSMPWGPSIDAEVGYRQQKIRSDFRRSQPRRAARSTPRTVRRVPVGRSEASAVIVRTRPAHAA